MSYGTLRKRNSNHLTFVLSKKRKNKKNESILEKSKFQLKLVKLCKKNANSRSHFHKINKKNKTKARTPQIPQPSAKSSLPSKSFAHKINDKMH